MSESDGEFDEYDFSEFTEQDLTSIDAHLARAYPPPIQMPVRDSPFNIFLAHKKYLSVTDLVSPIWCEVQHEYSLYGGRDKPVHLRPLAFTSKTGKHIRVLQQVACANDRRLKRGKSVHRALENQLRPVKSFVHVISDEERFGLRLVQLIDGFSQLVTDGITRELPVFTITHDQVIFGVIDEVLYSALTHGTPYQVVPSPPGSPPHKRQRLLSASSTPPMDPPNVSSSCVPGEPFELRIVDCKTRRFSNIPVDQDSLSSRLQLMLYHRMLSSLLNPEAFDFDLLWKRLDVNPTKPFSSQFLKDIVWEQRQADPADSTVHLNRLVSQWVAAVQRRRPEIRGVSQQLQLVYRQSASVGKQGDVAKHKGAESIDIEDPLEALLLRGELDLARAIEESLREMGHQQVDGLARNVVHNVKQAGSSLVGRTSAVWKDIVSPSDTDSEPVDSSLSWAIQQSLLTYAHQACADESQQIHAKQEDNSSDEISVISREQQAETAAEISPIIGTREFTMDDDELNTRLTDVLEWWFGVRPARGVDVSHTNRCFTCEYQHSCEWREKRAKEVAALASARRVQRTGADSTSVWPTTRSNAP